MECLFESALSYREMLVAKVEGLDDKILDTVAPEFNNTIRWQLAHLAATQGILTYGMLATENPMLSEEFISSVRKGTNHKDYSLNEDYTTVHLCELLIETTKQLRRDFERLKKLVFKPYETSTGLVLKDLQSALSYSNIHDGVHLGNIVALLKIIEG